MRLKTFNHKQPEAAPLCDRAELKRIGPGAFVQIAVDGCYGWCIVERITGDKIQCRLDDSTGNLQRGSQIEIRRANINNIVGQ